MKVTTCVQYGGTRKHLDLVELDVRERDGRARGGLGVELEGSEKSAEREKAGKRVWERKAARVQCAK